MVFGYGILFRPSEEGLLQAQRVGSVSGERDVDLGFEDELGPLTMG